MTTDYERMREALESALPLVENQIQPDSHDEHTAVAGMIRSALRSFPPASSGAGGDRLCDCGCGGLSLSVCPTPDPSLTTPEPRGCPTVGAVTDSYPVGPAWVEAEQFMRLQNPPDGLYVVRNGIAVAVTAEQMLAAWDASNANCGRVTAFERAFRLLTEKEWTAPEPSLPQSGWSYQP